MVVRNLHGNLQTFFLCKISRCLPVSLSQLSNRNHEVKVTTALTLMMLSFGCLSVLVFRLKGWAGLVSRVRLTFSFILSRRDAELKRELMDEVFRHLHK